MPLYEFRCKGCGRIFERFEREPPSCCGRVVRVFGFVFHREATCHDPSMPDAEGMGLRRALRMYEDRMEQRTGQRPSLVPAGEIVSKYEDLYVDDPRTDQIRKQVHDRLVKSGEKRSKGRFVF